MEERHIVLPLGEKKGEMLLARVRVRVWVRVRVSVRAGVRFRVGFGDQGLVSREMMWQILHSVNSQSDIKNWLHIHTPLGENRLGLINKDLSMELRATDRVRKVLRD